MCSTDNRYLFTVAQRRVENKQSFIHFFFRFYVVIPFFAMPFDNSYKKASLHWKWERLCIVLICNSIVNYLHTPSLPATSTQSNNNNVANQVQICHFYSFFRLTSTKVRISHETAKHFITFLCNKQNNRYQTDAFLIVLTTVVSRKHHWAQKKYKLSIAIFQFSIIYRIFATLL